jgi:hypothetical protein
LRPLLSIKERLESIQSKILDALIEELTHGKGIARITAADKLKEWSKEEGIGTAEGVEEEVSFRTLGVDQPMDDEAPEAVSA